MTLAALGIMTVMFALTLPLYPGSMQRALYAIAWSSRTPFVAVGGAMFASAAILTGMSIPLKKRWSKDLRGWID